MDGATVVGAVAAVEKPGWWGSEPEFLAGVVLMRQYRYVFDENQRWEMPTGGVKPGESLEEPE